MSSQEELDYRRGWQESGKRIGEHCNWQNPYQVLDFNNFSIIPIHLAQPWIVAKKYLGSSETFKQMVFNYKNPLGYQVIRLKDNLKRDFGTTSKYVIFGDFNVPRKMALFKTKIYRNLKDGLVEIFNDDVKTFPSKSAPERKMLAFKLQKVKIDMAYHNDGFQKTESVTLPLKGSDHYPIYFALDVK